MKLFVIDRILQQHSIECVYQDGNIAALMEVCRDGVATFGEWMLFGELTTKDELLAWLGY